MQAERRSSPSLALPRPGVPPTPTVPRPERFTLENGLQVVIVERNDLPQVAARLVVPAGSAADPRTAPGAASMVGALLTEGTDRRSALELNERIDSLGASLCARVGHDFSEVDLGLLSETLEEGLDLLAEVVGGAVFPHRELERIRAETLDALEARGDEPANVADDRVGEVVFGADHPYGRLPIGTMDSVASIQRGDLVDFHRLRYRPAGAVLVIAGDIDRRVLGRQLEKAFSEWRGSVDAIAYSAAPERTAAAGERYSIDWEEGEQAEIRVAGIGIPRNSPDWVAASVANYILGGSTITGRLGANLREDKGWTYGVRSGFSAGVQSGGWVVETAVDAAVTEAAVAEIERELEHIVADGVDEEELTRAREALILSLPRAFETPAKIVARLATIEAFGLEEDYWERFPARVAEVTAEKIQAIAAAHFDPAGLVRVTVAPAANGSH